MQAMEEQGGLQAARPKQLWEALQAEFPMLTSQVALAAGGQGGQAGAPLPISCGRHTGCASPLCQPTTSRNPLSFSGRREDPSPSGSRPRCWPSWRPCPRRTRPPAELQVAPADAPQEVGAWAGRRERGGASGSGGAVRLGGGCRMPPPLPVPAGGSLLGLPWPRACH